MSGQRFQARVFSDEEVAQVRRMFEKEGASIAAIAAHLHIAPATLSKRIKLWRLRRKSKSARPRPAKPNPDAPLDLGRTAARLEKRLAREIVTLEEKIDGGGDLEREARTLASLVKSLGELRRFAAGHAGEPVDRNAELDELRAELARRLDRLAPENTGSDVAAAPAGAVAG